MESQLNDIRLRLDSNQTLIKGLVSEKNHLQLSLTENIDQKEKFMAKCDELQKQYEETFSLMQEQKKSIVGIDEIRKDRDQRLKK